MQPAQTDPGARDRKPAGTGMPKLRKSCDPCSLAKRRCDGQPKCSLCVKKGIRCIYGERQKSGPKGRKGLAATSAIQQQQQLNQVHRPGTLPPPPRRRGPFVPAQQTTTDNNPASLPQSQPITGKRDLLGVSRVPPPHVLESVSEASFNEQEHDARSVASRDSTPHGLAGSGVSAVSVDPGHNGRGIVGSSSGEPMPVPWAEREAVPHYESLRDNAVGRGGMRGSEGVLNERHDLIVEAKQKDSEMFGNGRPHANRDEQFHEEHDRFRVYPNKMRRVAEEVWQARERQESAVDREPRRNQEENANVRIARTDSIPRSFNDHGGGLEGAAQYHPGDRGIESGDSPPQRQWSTGQRRPVSPSHVSRSDIQTQSVVSVGVNSQGGGLNQNGPRVEDDPAWRGAASWPRRAFSDEAAVAGRDAVGWATQPSVYPVRANINGGGDGERDGVPGTVSGYRMTPTPAVDSSMAADMNRNGGDVRSTESRAGGSRGEEHPPGTNHPLQQKQEYRNSTEPYFQRGRVAHEGVGEVLVAPATTGASASPSAPVPAGEVGGPWEHERRVAVSGGVAGSVTGRCNENEWWTSGRGVYQRLDPRFEIERRGENSRVNPYYGLPLPPPVTKKNLLPWPMEKIEVMEAMGASKADDEAAWTRIATRVGSSVSDAKDQWEAYCETMRRELWAAGIARDRVWSESGVPTSGRPPHWVAGEHPPWPYRADPSTVAAAASRYPMSVRSELKGGVYATMGTGFGSGHPHSPATVGRCSYCDALWQTNSPSDAAALQTGRWLCPACQAGTPPGPVPRLWQDDEGYFAIPTGGIGHSLPNTPTSVHLRRPQYFGPEPTVESHHAPGRKFSPLPQRSPPTTPPTPLNGKKSGVGHPIILVNSTPNGRSDMAKVPPGGGRAIRDDPSQKPGSASCASPGQPVPTPVPQEDGAECPLSRDKHNVSRGLSGSGDGAVKASASGDFAGGGNTANISDPAASTTTGMEDGNATATKVSKVAVSSSLSTSDPALSPKGVSVDKLSSKTMEKSMSTATASTATTATATLTPNSSVVSSKLRSQSPTRPSTTTSSKCGGNGAGSSISVPSLTEAAGVLCSLPHEKNEISAKKVESVESGVTPCDHSVTDGISISVGGRKPGRPVERAGENWNFNKAQMLYTQEAVEKLVQDVLEKTGRTATQDMGYSTQAREKRWSREDDEQLLEAVDVIRGGTDHPRQERSWDWEDIAEKFDGRLADECRERWSSLILPARNDIKEVRQLQRGKGEHTVNDNHPAATGSERVVATKWNSVAHSSRGIGKMFGEEQRRPHAAADFKDDHRNRDGPDREGLLEVKLLRYGKDDATSSTSKTVAEAAASTPRNDEGDDRKQNDRHRWNTSPERLSMEIGMPQQRIPGTPSYFWNEDGRGTDKASLKHPRPPSGSGMEDDSQHQRRVQHRLDRYPSTASRRSDYGHENYEGGGSDLPWPRQPLSYEGGKGWSPGSVWRGGAVQRRRPEGFRADEQLLHQHRASWPMRGVEPKPEAPVRRWEVDGPTPRRDEELYRWSNMARSGAAGIGGRRYTEEEVRMRINQMQDEEERRLDAIERKREGFGGGSGYERRPAGGDSTNEGDGRGMEGSRRMVSSPVEPRAEATMTTAARKASCDVDREAGDGGDSTGPGSGPRGRVGGTSYRRESPKSQLMSRVMMEGERNISGRRSQPQQSRSRDGHEEVNDNMGRDREVRNSSCGGGDPKTLQTKEHPREVEKGMVSRGSESPFAGRRSELPRGSPVTVGERSYAHKKPMDRLRTEGWTHLTSTGSSTSSRMEPIERMRGVRTAGQSVGRDDGVACGGRDRKDEANATSDIGDGRRNGMNEGCSSAITKPTDPAASCVGGSGGGGASVSNSREVKA